MRVLVTGGAGFVMSNVVRALLSEDAEARAVVLDLGGRDEAAETFAKSRWWSARSRSERSPTWCTARR